jgi:hypothetical protein
MTKEHYDHYDKKTKLKPATAIYAGGAVVLVVASFLLGIQYQKGKAPKVVADTATAQTGRQFSANGGFGGGRQGLGGALGSVTAVSATSITVQNSRTNADSTLAITSSTTVTNNGTAATISDIKVGDTVLVRTSTSDQKTASQITLNPQFPTGGPSGANGGTPPADNSGTTYTN